MGMILVCSSFFDFSILGSLVLKTGSLIQRTCMAFGIGSVSNGIRFLSRFW